MEEARIESNRRSSDRRPIEQRVQYKAYEHTSLDQVGVGKTINMSRTGVLFTTAMRLATGQPVELAISWPLNRNGLPLRLVIRGNVVRADEVQAAITINTYDFETIA